MSAVRANIRNSFLHFECVGQDGEAVGQRPRFYSDLTNLKKQVLSRPKFSPGGFGVETSPGGFGDETPEASDGSESGSLSKRDSSSTAPMQTPSLSPQQTSTLAAGPPMPTVDLPAPAADTSVSMWVMQQQQPQQEQPVQQELLDQQLLQSMMQQLAVQQRQQQQQARQQPQQQSVQQQELDQQLMQSMMQQLAVQQQQIEQMQQMEQQRRQKETSEQQQMQRQQMQQQQMQQQQAAYPQPLQQMYVMPTHCMQQGVGLVAVAPMQVVPPPAFQDQQAPRASPQEEGVTVMLRHIPNKYTQDQFMKTLAQYLPAIDFVYLPVDFRNHCNLGYAFLNFSRGDVAQRFVAEFDGSRLPGYPNSNKVVKVMRARVQGLENNVRRLRNSSIMELLPDNCKPMIFKNGIQVPFPAPDVKLAPSAPW